METWNDDSVLGLWGVFMVAFFINKDLEHGLLAMSCWCVAQTLEAQGWRRAQSDAINMLCLALTGKLRKKAKT